MTRLLNKVLALKKYPNYRFLCHKSNVLLIVGNWLICHYRSLTKKFLHLDFFELIFIDNPRFVMKAFH